MPMSPRLLRPRSTASSHPEALDWATRATAAGGTVTTTSLAAVNAFCRAIDAAGIRDRIYRLNLFAGGNINAALIPLYRSIARGGTVIGSAADTNNGFVSADFAETGTNGGFNKAVQTVKNISTGVTTSNLPQFVTAHVALAFKGNSVANAGFAFGDNSNEQHFVYVVHGGSPAYNTQLCANGGEIAYSNALAASGRFITSRTANNAIALYRNGVSVGSSASAVTSSAAGKALNLMAQTFITGCLRYYSIGNGLTAAQAAAFDSALSAYLTTMSRTT